MPFDQSGQNDGDFPHIESHEVYEDLPDFINEARRDQNVQDILYDSDGTVRIHSFGRFTVIGKFREIDSLRFVTKCGSQPTVQRFFDEDNQTLAATLPDGERIEAVHKSACPAGHGWAMRIPGRLLTLANMRDLGSVTNDGYQFLCAAAGQKSIMFSGMPGTGKTTALKAVLVEPLPKGLRQIIIESDPECPVPEHGLRLIAKKKKKFNKLIERSFRLLPEILVISEVLNSDAAFAMARAARACVGMSSVHARDALTAPRQLKEMGKKAGGIPARDIALACEVVVQMEKDGKGGRRVTEIVTTGVKNGKFVVKDRIC